MTKFTAIQHNLKKHQIKLGQFLASHGASEYTILIIYSIIIGTIAGLAAVGFHETISIISKLFSLGKQFIFKIFLVNHPVADIRYVCVMADGQAGTLAGKTKRRAGDN